MMKKQSMDIFSRPNFSLIQLTECLRSLNIDFTLIGTEPSGNFRFMSLREQEAHGIFFVTPQAEGAFTFKNSIILAEQSADWGPGCITLLVAQPQVTFYRLMRVLAGHDKRSPGIDPTAIISPDAEVSNEAYIGPYCVVQRCRIGPGAILHSFVVVMDGSDIEADVTIEPHSTIGATGVAWVRDNITGERVIQPQLGFTRIGRGSFLGSDVSVVRGSVNETTVVGAGSVIAHGSKIGHGARLGTECHFANNVSIGGNVTLGEKCFLGSGAVVRAQVNIGERTTVGAGAVVVKDYIQTDCVLTGVPAQPIDRAGLRMTGVPKPAKRED